MVVSVNRNYTTLQVIHTHRGYMLNTTRGVGMKA